MKAPPYALTRAPQGAKLADWRSQIRGFLEYNLTVEDRRFCLSARASVETRRSTR